MLLMWGEQDRLMAADAYAARWQELLPHARTVTIGNAGHMLPYELPSSVWSCIMEAVPAPG
jgi:pimeloyl-ACP methyl ester carboxylesterase